MAGSSHESSAPRSIAGQKRKREAVADHADQRARCFDIRSTERPDTPAITLTPKCLLPRAHLPLTWLDLSRTGSGLHAGNIHLLETTYERGLPPSVLIASHEHNNERYALERAAERRYMAIKLVSSLDSEKLARRAIWTAPTKPVTIEAVEEKDITHAELRRKRRVQPEVVSKDDSVRLDEETQLHSLVTQVGDEAAQIDHEETQTSQPVNSEQVLQDLARQYLEAVYLSKTSLAYFVKGPLSRIRSQAQADQVQSFLRELVMSTSMTDQRLKEHIPGVIKELADDTKKIRKRKWKPKRDRQGFLSFETEHIAAWWQKCESSDKQELSLLRNRETFLQVILTLELLASDAKTEGKKKLDLNQHLEALLDRLVIWHSIDIQSPVKGAERRDELKNFCVEVIIPFFMPRMPKIATSVNKKLGGPTSRSPPKKASRRPGAPLRSASSHVRRDSSVSILSESRRSALDSLTRREIDLTAASAASKEKLRKRTEQEARVREAVAGIRKPDRATALQENAALIDAKFAQTLQRSRKPNVPDIHIQATPRLVKSVSAGVVDSIPQTSRRVTATPSRLTATPSRVSDSVRADRSPLLSRTELVESTPSRPRTLFLVDATPKALVPLATACPNAVLSTPMAEKSIYDVLGWNDDRYEVLT